MDIQKALLSKIESFILTAKIAESTFGFRAVNDGKFVSKLKSGSSITLKTYERVLEYMNEHAPMNTNIEDNTNSPQQNHVEQGA